MKLEKWYEGNFNSHLRGRYVNLLKISPLLELYGNDFEITVIGTSEENRDIPMVKIGSGKNIVLAWSQMHGNESTTTKAIFDFLAFVHQKDFFQQEIGRFLAAYTFYVIPMLNPDGAERYTRENANGVDLNRDARELTQKESKNLHRIFNKLHPQLCLNLHDQRSIYGLETGRPATVSFLAPAADAETTITASRKVSMEKIVRMERILQNFIPGSIGRYDDSFNPNCVGDAFQMANVPTILFEAGHFPGDYHREETRKYIFYALLALFGFFPLEEDVPYKDYFTIPENRKNYRDVILRNVMQPSEREPMDIAIQYEEVLRHDKVEFEPVISEVGSLHSLFGHREIDAKEAELLTESHQELKDGVKVSKIVAKSDKNRVYFQRDIF